MGPLSIRHGTAQHVIARIENETRRVARVLAGTFLSHMAGRSFILCHFNHQLVSCSLSFPSYSTVGCRRTVCRRTARLEFHLKIRTTPGWKIELRTVSLHANNVCCEADFFSGIADFETTPRRRVETFQPGPSPARHVLPACATSISSTVLNLRVELCNVTRRRIEK